jgi:hypothetical protein
MLITLYLVFIANPEIYVANFAIHVASFATYISKPETEKVVETKQKSTKKCCRSLDLQHFFCERI